MLRRRVSTMVPVEGVEHGIPPQDGSAAVQLSVVIPAYNEATTVATLLERVACAPFQKEIVVVDDGSTDQTADIVSEWIAQLGGQCSALLLRHVSNRGKGAAIRTGLALARGEATIVQDADLEYDPGDYPALIEPILSGRADVVYGSRFMHKVIIRPVRSIGFAYCS